MRRRKGFYELFIKRVLDICCSFISIIALSPLLVILSVLVYFKLGSPIIFKQKRPGLNERIFTMYKFRTMTDTCDADGNLLSDEERLTKFGKWLRGTSMDELPELFNILKGDMSIVGPRPQLVRDMVFMSERQRKRHTAKPGLTGWAQVNGRNALLWEEKFEYDLAYIEDVNFHTDVQIIRKTVDKVLGKEDISMEGMATVDDFGDYLLKNAQITKEVYVEMQEKADRLLGV